MVVEKQSKALLRWTGYPLVDVGAATICAFNGKRNLADVIVGDLDATANYVRQHYTDGPIKSFLTSVFPNAGYVNPTMGVEKREQEIQRSLYGYRRAPEPAAPPCLFCGRPANGSAFRQHIPLTAGEGIMNFGPGGRSGTAVCGACLLCIQVAPLGCAMRCNGRLLLVHCADFTLTYEFANEFLSRNRQILSLSDAADRGSTRYPHTLLLQTLSALDDRRSTPDEQRAGDSVTAYHFTNYGTNADVAIIHLPSELVRFFAIARSATFRSAWGAVVARAWERPRVRQVNRGAKESGGNGDLPEDRGATLPGTRRNFVYEDLCQSPFNAHRFLRRHFLRLGWLNPLSGGANEPMQQAIPSWKLVVLFLREVMHMDKHRIECIYAVGGRIAEVIESGYDRLLRDLYGMGGKAPSYKVLRSVLVKASKREVEQGRSPVISFKDFIDIFEEGEDAPYKDWDLAADLLFIRVLDALHTDGWLKTHQEEVKGAIQDSEVGVEDRDDVGNE